MLYRTGKPQYVVRAKAASRDNSPDYRPPERDGSGLVEDRDVCSCEVLERGTVSHDDMSPSCRVDAAYERNGGSKKKRTRRRDDENREHTNEIVRDSINNETHGKRQWRKPQTVAISESLQWRLACLRRANEFDDLCVLALTRRSERLHLERAFEIDASAE
jgi:hypothetical protein